MIQDEKGPTINYLARGIKSLGDISACLERGTSKTLQNKVQHATHMPPELAGIVASYASRQTWCVASVNLGRVKHQSVHPSVRRFLRLPGFALSLSVEDCLLVERHGIVTHMMLKISGSTRKWAMVNVDTSELEEIPQIDSQSSLAILSDRDLLIDGSCMGTFRLLPFPIAEPPPSRTASAHWRLSYIEHAGIVQYATNSANSSEWLRFSTAPSLIDTLAWLTVSPGGSIDRRSATHGMGEYLSQKNIAHLDRVAFSNKWLVLIARRNAEASNVELHLLQRGKAADGADALTTPVCVRTLSSSLWQDPRLATHAKMGVGNVFLVAGAQRATGEHDQHLALVLGRVLCWFATPLSQWHLDHDAGARTTLIHPASAPGLPDCASSSPYAKIFRSNHKLGILILFSTPNESRRTLRKLTMGSHLNDEWLSGDLRNEEEDGILCVELSQVLPGMHGLFTAPC